MGAGAVASWSSAFSTRGGLESRATVAANSLYSTGQTSRDHRYLLTISTSTTTATTITTTTTTTTLLLLLLLLLLLRLLLLLVNYDYFSSSSFSSSPTSITTTTTTYASYLLLRNTFLLLFYFLYFSSSPCSPLLSILNSCFFHWSLAHFYSLLYLVFYPIFSRCAFVLLLYVLHASIPLYSPCGSLLSVLPTESTFRYSSGRL